MTVDKVLEVRAWQRVLFARGVHVGAEVVDPQEFRLRPLGGWALVEDNTFIPFPWA